jgi:hypothetical protein
MKNLICTALLAVPVMIAAPALALNSELSIAMSDNTKFTLTIDNSYYATPSNTYNVTNLIPGMHRVRMTSAPAVTYGMQVLPRLLFDGWVNIPENARVIAYPVNMTQLNIVSVVPLVQNVYYDPYNPYGNNGYNNGYGNNNGYGGYNTGYGNGGQCGTGNGYGNNGYGNNGWNNAPVYYGMSASNFDALKNTIRNQSFDSSKLTVAQQAVASNYLTAAQVAELVQLFSFESSKVDIAKYAYSRTVDRNNYYLVSNAFTYSSSIDELSGYINNYHG